jgi:hypothetical protein
MTKESNEVANIQGDAIHVRLPRSSRSGSENRRRRQRVLIRLDDREYAEVTAGANASGLTIASYVRQRVLSGPVRKVSRRAPVDAALLSKALGELNRVGSNLNQIARGLNSGDELYPGELNAALDVYRGTVVLIMRALEAPRGNAPDADHH